MSGRDETEEDGRKKKILQPNQRGGLSAKEGSLAAKAIPRWNRRHHHLLHHHRHTLSFFRLSTNPETDSINTRRRARESQTRRRRTRRRSCSENTCSTSEQLLHAKLHPHNYSIRPAVDFLISSYGFRAIVATFDSAL